ncbi:hypothetical protein, partial [Burkholderia ubonensis]|uniref:hypothetical protein n=1 Tax=Burkholderia ubonensis TaxID=101571 RepID=UPI001E4CA780
DEPKSEPEKVESERRPTIRLHHIKEKWNEELFNHGDYRDPGFGMRHRAGDGCIPLLQASSPPHAYAPRSSSMNVGLTNLFTNRTRERTCFIN